MSVKENIFVFVVCGAREHIDTLHFSLRALKRFSKNKIIVLTDSSRNDIPVEHDNVIDVPTPGLFNHHQASIFLKTEIHRFLPARNLYCYLDTDVVALNDSVDSIFDHYNSPITFCSDHCRINAFSPAAMNCGCQERFDEHNRQLEFCLKDFEKNFAPKLSYIDQCIAEIERSEKELKDNSLKYQWHKLMYAMPGKYYVLNDKYKMEKATGHWYDKEGMRLKLDVMDYVFDKTGFKWVAERKEWQTREGVSFSNHTCDHLVEGIKDKFGVEITVKDWNHWNGGVFLFDDSSHGFLDTWHQATMEIFNDKKWKTRDQGTLAMTVWKSGLQGHPILPLEFNFIADYNSTAFTYPGDLTFTFEEEQRIIKPNLIHIYHHWGDEDWQVWRDVKNHSA